ncbi:MAG: phosphatidate cytidylyltransferase [Lachnospiraceae bacterium]|nr:phosphatidate cytidylyltransferase [Lachnospiraceae bacterium]
MFKTRLLSGIVLVVLVIGVLYLGGYVTAGAMLLLSLGGVFELLRIYKLHNTPIGIVTYLATIIYYGLLIFDKNQFVMPLIIVLVLTILGIYVATYPRFTDKDAMAAVLSFMYVTVMLSYMYLVRDLAHGGALVVMVFVCSWVNDTCVYCIGVTMGKHKMTPKLSPKKSVEGLVGGIVGSAAFGALYGMFFNKQVMTLENAPITFAIIGAVGAVVAVIGDLAASAIKRNNDIKDYGKLIPGHGGIMDRFDSIIFTAPIIYYGFIYMI